MVINATKKFLKKCRNDIRGQRALAKGLKAIANPYHDPKFTKDLDRLCCCNSGLKARFCHGKPKMKMLDNVSAKRIRTYLEWRTNVGEEATRWIAQGMNKDDAISKARDQFPMPEFESIF